MKRPYDQINCRVHTIRLMIAILSLIFISPVARADTFAQLKGYWQCQEDGHRSTLEFMSWEI